MPVLQQCKHVLLLTGTPALGKPVELFTLLKIIRPDVFHNFHEYAGRYCDPKKNQYNPRLMDYDGSSNEKELHYILK